MPRAYSMDLRKRVIEACDERETIAQVAERFKVSASFVVQLRQQRRASGTLDPKPHGGLMCKSFSVRSSPCDSVAWNNLSSHQVASVREVIEAVGAILKPLPPYSPIEPVFAKLKALLRKAAEGTVETLWDTLAMVMDQLTPTECENYLRGAGYAVQAKRKCT